MKENLLVCEATVARWESHQIGNDWGHEFNLPIDNIIAPVDVLEVVPRWPT